MADQKNAPQQITTDSGAAGYNPDDAPQVGNPAGGPPKLGDPAAPLNPFNPGTPNNDFIHGAKGRLLYMPPKVGSVAPPSSPVALPIQQISFDDQVTTEDITHSMAGGCQVMLDGIKSVNGSITFSYDALNVMGTVGTNTQAINPFRSRFYCTLYVYPDGVTLTKFAALISKCSFSTGPKAGAINVSADYMSTGPITYPTASQTTATTPLEQATSGSS